MSAPSPSARLRWGLLGAGGIARAFARGVLASTRGVLAAVGSRDAARARAFVDEFPGCAARAHGSYDDLLADEGVDAIYIATPHPQHVTWVMRAAAAGRHVLVEKPLALNHADAARAVAAARQADVTFAEAWKFRFHPQTARVLEIIRSGELGEIGMVQATFSFRSEFRPTHRLWANALGGGGILDVGGYPVSYARMIAGSAAGRAFLDPERVRAVGRLDPRTGVDRVAAAVLEFPGGLLAQVSCGVGLTQETAVRIYGAEGWLHLPEPFSGRRNPAVFTRHSPSGDPETIAVAAPLDPFTYEADAFAAAVLAGERELAACTPEDSLGNMRALDAWRAEIGLVYDEERDQP